MKKYLPIFFFFLILNHAYSQFSSGTNSWTYSSNFTLGSGSYSSGYGAIAFGYQSTAYGGVGLGYQSYASGTGSAAIGYSNYSSGNGTTSLGYDNTAQSNYSTSIGYSNYVSSANGGVAIGYDNDARNYYAISMGYSNYVSGYAGVALGYNNYVSGNYAVALGINNTASDYASTVIGQFNSSGSSATSSSTFSTSAPAFVIGNGTSSGSLSDAFKVMFNGDAYISSSLYLGGTAVTSTAAELNYVDGVTSNIQTQLDSKQATITGAATTIATDDLTVSRALTSNGSGKVEVSAVTSTELGYLDGVTSNVQTQLDSKLSSSGNITTGGNIVIPDSGNIGSTSDTDAITIANSGNVTFGQDVTVNGDVVISSDARLKSNIVSLGSTLPKLLQIDGKSYEMKGKQKIGVLAQEIQEVFPELVSEDDNEMLAVNYQGLVPVLINALKDQQNEIDELKEMVQALISRK